MSMTVNIKGYETLLGMFSPGLSETSCVRVVNALVNDKSVRDLFIGDARSSLQEATGSTASVYDSSIESHIPGHAWGFLTGYGIPVFDLGHAWWSGGIQRYESAINVLGEAVEDCFSREGQFRNVPLDGMEKGAMLVLLLSNCRTFGDTLRSISSEKRGGSLSIREIVDLDPQPPEGSRIFAGSRLSFARYHLAFKVAGESRIDTLKRKGVFAEELSRLLAANGPLKTTPAAAVTVSQDLDPKEVMGNLLSSVRDIYTVLDSFLAEFERSGNSEYADILLTQASSILKMKRFGDCQENYILERTLIFTARHVKSKNDQNIKVRLEQFISDLFRQDTVLMFVPLRRAIEIAQEIMGE